MIQKEKESPQIQCINQCPKQKQGTYRHITPHDMKPTWSSEFAAELNMIHILKKKKQ